MKPMLVLIDLQADYLTAARLEPSAESIIAQTRELLVTCRKQNVSVAHVWTTVDRCSDNRMAHWKDAGRWSCEAGTPGHATPECLAPLDDEIIVHKSGFTGFPGLQPAVEQTQTDTLILCGVYLHACVRQTALDAYQSGLQVVIAADAVGSNDPLHAVITRQYLAARAIRFESTERLRDLTDGAPRKKGEPEGVCPPTPDVSVRELLPSGSPATTALEKPALGLADALARDADQLAIEMSDEIGKPVQFGRAEVHATATMIKAIVDRWQRHRASEGNAGEENAGDGIVIRSRPHGDVAIITPWNNPVYIPVGKIVPAVLYGNRVHWKPAPEATALARRMINMLNDAGWRQDAVQLVEGGRDAGETLMNDDRVAAVTITGSSAAGFAAQAICGRRRIPLQAELGGNNAAIVCPDADLQLAARQIAAGAFEQAGQRCTANSRVIVDESCRTEFLNGLAHAASQLKWGVPGIEDTDIGPLVSPEQARRVATLVDLAKADGLELIRPLGDSPPSGAMEQAGVWYPPTLICCDEQSHPVVQEEVFGPVLVVQTSHSFTEAIALNNGVTQGLAAAIFTCSQQTIDQFLDEAQAGIVKINQSTASASPDIPFGGWKSSGIGPPEHGDFDREFFTRPQVVYLDQRDT